ncbi:MAG: LptA/OstA family protein [Pseudomonadota bacterium]
MAAALFLVGAGAITPAPVSAQQPLQTSPSLSLDSDEPVDIEADTLEVYDDQKIAIFIGNVIVRQGDLEMRSPRLQIDYTGGGAAENTVAPGAGQISRIEATGGVRIKTPDQTARGERAVYMVDDQIITLSGNVVLTQDESVLRGTELIVNLATNSSRLVSTNNETGGRVRGLFVPESN